MNRFLSIYLNDQLALGVLWRELARRARDNNKGTDLGEALERVETGIAEDVETFESIMHRLGVRTNHVKTCLAIAAERAGRLKPNGMLRGFSPLSRFLELEILVMGIEGKKQLWGTLRDLAGLDSQLRDLDFDRLVERAERQRDVLDPFRRRAGTDAFSENRTPS